MLKVIFLIICLACLAQYGRCFVPAKIIDSLVEIADKESSHLNFNKASTSFSHENILRRGLIRSVARFFYDKPNGSSKIQINNMDRYLNDIDRLYRDYYGLTGIVRSAKIKWFLEWELEPNVAVVDFDPDTKDLPYAHFDAERLIESNDRVMSFKAQIDNALKNENYKQARKLTAQILHTIQDFYSHSNWVEIGQTAINTKIGTDMFKLQAIVTPTDPNICKSNCKLVSTPCPSSIKAFTEAMQLLNPDFSFTCPIEYYMCDGNIVTLNKLASGYYTNQKLSDGTVVENPGTLMKCNHGGVLDANSKVKQALGGINKDAGIYLISPHANLHLAAANLAELHTEYFFNTIRTQIGDTKFSDFLHIE